MSWPLPKPPPFRGNESDEQKGNQQSLVYTYGGSSSEDNAPKKDEQDKSVAGQGGYSAALNEFIPVAGTTNKDGRVVERSNYSYSSELKRDGVQHKEERGYEVQGESGTNGQKQEWFVPTGKKSS